MSNNFFNYQFVLPDFVNQYFWEYKYNYFWFHLGIILINSIWLFRYGNIYWWSFYFLYAPFLFVYILQYQSFQLHQSLNGSVKLMIIFILVGLYSIVMSTANMIDGVYAIGLRLLPLLAIYHTYSIFYKSGKHYKDVKYIVENIFSVILFLQILVGSCQLFLWGYKQDLLGGFAGNAHSFSFLTLFIAYYFLATKSNYHHKIIFGYAFILVVMADFKLGIISFVGSYLLVKIILNRKLLKYGVYTAICSLVLILLLPFILPYLPSQYAILFSILNFDNIFVLSSPYPPNMELFKGYIQLFTDVFDSLKSFLIGVGPGTYGTNIAMLKEKELASEYIIKFREILDSEGVIRGTLLSRNNATISLIAEFGVLGFLLYSILLVKILLWKGVLPDFGTYYHTNKKDGKVLEYYLVLVTYFFINAFFISAIEEGIYISFIAISGVLVIIQNRRKLDGKKVIVYNK